MYLTQGLHRALQQQPDRTAVYFGALRRSFAELGDRVARLAGALQTLGMASGDRVAMLAMNSDRYLEYQLGVPWGGGVLNPCNVRWSVAEIVYSLKDSGSLILIVDDAFKAMVEAIRRDTPSIRQVIYAGDSELPAGMHHYETLLAKHAPIADVCREGDDLLGIFYTGGTTGFPKGVMLSHANLFASGMSLLGEGISPRGSVYLHAAPMFHLADFGISIPQFLAGNAHAIIPAFKPEAVLEAIARDRVTDVLLVPTMIQMLVDHPAMQAGHDISSLKRVVYGASSISEAVLDRAMAALPGVEFFQAYGMTELSPVATINPAWYHTAEGRKAGKLRSGGRASFGTEVRIVDELGVPVPLGTVGEVAVRGPNVMLGYWNKPEQTAAALRNGWMHTGDGAYMDADGFIFVVDRLKDMIKSGGENVFSAEVENALAQHAAVAACAVIGIPSDEWGEAVHAVVVAKPGASASGDELIAHCKTLIAGYKCPRTIELRDALPLSGAGKILKTVLRKPFWEGRSTQIG